ncbi:hypothetical protein D3C75_1084540 [compost metagenome]
MATYVPLQLQLIHQFLKWIQLMLKNLQEMLLQLQQYLPVAFAILRLASNRQRINEHPDSPLNISMLPSGYRSSDYEILLPGIMVQQNLIASK